LSASPFEPSREAALARLAAVRPGDYARTRNAIDGAVSRLSPYLTHGLLSLPEVLAAVASHSTLDLQHKFVFELGWREFFAHVWQHRGDQIFKSLHAGPLPEGAYAAELPLDIREARTGLPVIDTAVRTLYASGYLHNHARMWLASYVVHLRKVHWRTGADWMYGHLLDGDLASNHLSWQWVAGTGSHKPYLFNAENVEKYAPPAWHSPGSVVDTSYAQLDLIARNEQAVAVEPLAAGVAEPVLYGGAAGVVTDVQGLAGQDVWLVHPWALGPPPPGLVPVAVLAHAFHRAWPWSAARWAFVARRMAALTSHRIEGDVVQLAGLLQGARSVRTLADPHMRALLPPRVEQQPVPRLFAPVARPCASFSQWWREATRHAKSLSDLPGLQAIVQACSAGPLFDGR
jgi:deoxyribodipyrimidine photo-lyase